MARVPAPKVPSAEKALGKLSGSIAKTIGRGGGIVGNPRAGYKKSWHEGAEPAKPL